MRKFNDFIEHTKDDIRAIHTNAYISVYCTSDDMASQVYVRNKVKTGKSLGITVKVRHISHQNTDTALATITSWITYLDNKNPDCLGIIVQLPLRKDLQPYKDLILGFINPDKDIDGLSADNIKDMYSGNTVIAPCTAKGIVDGKHMVIVNRSEIVGRPLALLALNDNATVTVCHSHTNNIAALTRQADILVSAVGKPKFITKGMVKEGAIVVDVGINRNQDGHLCGDVDLADVIEKATFVTPVPKGVGRITVLYFLRNALVCGGLLE